MDIFCFQVIIGFYWNDVHILLHMVSIFAKFYAISLIKFVFINLALFHFAKTMATGGRGSSYFSKVNSIWACLWYPLWAIHINLLKKQDKICILETLPSTNIPWLNFYYLVYSYRVEEQTVQLLQIQDFRDSRRLVPVCRG